jgi:hypothetical protein
VNGGVGIEPIDLTELANDVCCANTKRFFEASSDFRVAQLLPTSLVLTKATEQILPFLEQLDLPRRLSGGAGKYDDNTNK